MYEFPEGFADKIRSGIKQWQRTSLMLAEQGWTAPGSLTPADVYDLIEACSTPEEVDEAFVRLFSDNDTELFSLTASQLLETKVLTRWYPLLEQVFSSYQRSHYLVAIPALLTIFEGLLATDAGCSTKVTRIVAAKVREIEERLPNSVTLAEWQATEKFVENLFAYSRFDEEPPSGLNRNWVLHGRDALDWTQADCLRLVVALETVSSLLEPVPV